MTEAQRGRYAVGYFESWNLDSIMAVADAAEKMRSPVVLGVSGIYLPHPERKVRDPLSHHAVIGLDVCRQLTVPACLLFNESSHLNWVHAALELGFNLVMFRDQRLTRDLQIQVTQGLVSSAHQCGVAVEAELHPLAEAADDRKPKGSRQLTDSHEAAEFVERTGIDALVLTIGQCSCHKRHRTRLDLPRLAELGRLPVPLVLNGATSADRDDLRVAVEQGIRKINVGSLLKQVYFQALREACAHAPADDKPHEVVGSGLGNDVLVAARLAIQNAVESWMELIGSAGKA
jgi:fructose/tagatose bisphosphate aldolase